MEAAGVACPVPHSADLQLRRVRGCLQQAPDPSVTPGESASATAVSTPLRPRFDLPRLQGGLRVETEGHSASGGGSEAVRLDMEVWSEPFSDDAVAAGQIRQTLTQQHSNFVEGMSTYRTLLSKHASDSTIVGSPRSASSRTPHLNLDVLENRQPVRIHDSAHCRMRSHNSLFVLRMPTPSAIILTKLSPRDHLFHNFSCKSNTPTFPRQMSHALLHEVLVLDFAHSVCIPHRRRDHTAECLDNTSFSPPHPVLLDHVLVARSRRFLRTARTKRLSHCLIWALLGRRKTIVATDGCSPADETRCSAARLCWPALSFIPSVA